MGPFLSVKFFSDFTAEEFVIDIFRVNRLTHGAINVLQNETIV